MAGWGLCPHRELLRPRSAHQEPPPRPRGLAPDPRRRENEVKERKTHPKREGRAAADNTPTQQPPVTALPPVTRLFLPVPVPVPPRGAGRRKGRAAARRRRRRRRRQAVKGRQAALKMAAAAAAAAVGRQATARPRGLRVPEERGAAAAPVCRS